MKLRFDVLDAIKLLYPQYVFIVSNQGGIESGFIEEHGFCAKLEYVARVISEYCDCECYGEYCRTNDKSNLWRKPNTGMLEYFLEQYFWNGSDNIKQKSLMIGDASGKEGQFSDSDKITAANFRIDYMDVNDFVNALL